MNAPVPTPVEFMVSKYSSDVMDVIDIALPDRENPVNSRIISPIDMTNLKNVQNLMYLRVLAIECYKPLCKNAQNTTTALLVTFLFADIIIYNSIFTPTSAVAYLYGMYHPK